MAGSSLIKLARSKASALRQRLAHPTRRSLQSAPATPRPPLDPLPRLSVVLGSLNRRPFLEAAIDSVRREITGIPAEIIVIDGGSTDGSIEWLTAQPDIITMVQHNRVERDGRKFMRRSWGSFMNMGFRAARGEAVLMISDDCILLPGSVAAGLECLQREGSPPVGGVAFYFRDWPVEQDYYVQHTLGGTLMVNHGLFSRAALQAVNGAEEERYLFYKADGDLAIRIWRAGFRIVDCPDAIVEHYMDASEAQRLMNNATLDHDRAAYAARWLHHLGPDPIKGMGKKKIPFRDPAQLAEGVFGKIVAGSDKGAA